jgi:hypothetical protein
MTIPQDVLRGLNIPNSLGLIRSNPERQSNTQKTNSGGLASHSSLEHLRRQLTQEPRPIRLWKVQENLIDTFPLGVADGTQAITRHSASQCPREVSHDESQSTSTNTADDGPKSGCWAGPSTTILVGLFGQPFFAHHLFKHRPKLVGIALAAVAESKAGPWEATGIALRNLIVDLFFGLLVCADLVVLIDLLKPCCSRWSFGGVGRNSIRVGL